MFPEHARKENPRVSYIRTTWEWMRGMLWPTMVREFASPVHVMAMYWLRQWHCRRKQTWKSFTFWRNSPFRNQNNWPTWIVVFIFSELRTGEWWFQSFLYFLVLYRGFSYIEKLLAPAKAVFPSANDKSRAQKAKKVGDEEKTCVHHVCNACQRICSQ